MLKKSKKKSFSLNMEISIGSVSDMDVMLFTKHLSIALKSGLSLIEALDIIKAQSTGKMKKVVIDIMTKVESGKSFHEALHKYEKYFSKIYLNMVRSGELSGTLEKNLQKLSHTLEKRIKLRKKVKSAMIYPMAIFIAIFGLGMSVAVFVLPKILPLFKTLDIELPLMTRVLMYVAELFSDHGWTLVIGSTATLIMIFWLLKRDFVKPVTHEIILRLPIINKISRNINLANFSLTLSSLLDTGIAVDESLRITENTLNNYVYKKAIHKAIPAIEAGTSIHQAIEKYPHLFPPLVTKMIGMGERTGNLEDTLQYLGDFYEEEVDETIKNLSTILEPFLLIFIGLVVGLVAIAILGPIYEITGKIR